MTREIKPEDVTRLIREGKLEFGMELEFCNEAGKWVRGRFIGIDSYYSIVNFLARITTESEGEIPIIELQRKESFIMARFPLPSLRDGDPVVVKRCNSGPEYNVVFKRFHSDGGILSYANGTNNWTSRHQNIESETYFPFHRYPTKQELSEAGYTGDQIKEMTTRWGTETPRNQTHKAWQQSANGTVRVG